MLAVRRKLPAIRQKLLDAALRVDSQHWGGLCAAATEALVPRCVEFHTVKPPGALPSEDHFDQGSFLTIDVMLSHSSDFEGGQFKTKESDGTFASHSFDRGDALCFVSHKPHCILPVTAGKRHVLVMEIWEGEERSCGHRCGRHWGECGFR
jgi:hypothetical protein